MSDVWTIQENRGKSEIDNTKVAIIKKEKKNDQQRTTNKNKLKLVWLWPWWQRMEKDRLWGGGGHFKNKYEKANNEVIYVKTYMP